MSYPFLEEAEEYVTGLFEKFCTGRFVFHNLEHTKDVVVRSLEMANYYRLDPKQIMQLGIAAWFHDTGYLFAEPAVHEEMSIEIIKEWASTKKFDLQDLEVITGCIAATKNPPAPRTLLQKIICDADTYHLGTDEFKESDRKVFEEFRYWNPGLTRIQFAKGTVNMLKSQHFFTSYCITLLTEPKNKNLELLKKEFSLE